MRERWSCKSDRAIAISLMITNVAFRAREIQSSVTKSKAPVVRKRVVKGSNLQAHPPPPVVESPVRRPTKGSATKAFSVSAPHHPAPKIVPQNLAAITESFRRQQFVAL